MICSASSRAFDSTRSLSWLMRRACLTSSGMATRSWSMRSRTAACSRMTWLVIGTFLPLTTRASRRSTRNCMSTSPSRSAVNVPQEYELLLADLLDPCDVRRGRDRGHVFAVRAHDHEPVRSDRRSQRVMTQRGLGNADVGERWVAEHDLEWTAWPEVEVGDHVRGDDLGSRLEIGRREIAAERLDRLRAALH